jgi:hypothetical protein
VQVWRDDKNTIPKVKTSTIDVVTGVTDPIYLKQGIYQAKGHVSTHVVYFGPLTHHVQPPHELGTGRPELYDVGGVNEHRPRVLSVPVHRVEPNPAAGVYGVAEHRHRLFG